MARAKTLTLVDINNAEMPATRPVLLESAASTATWKREYLNAKDERDMIDAQIASANRTYDHTIAEATAVRDARVSTADRAMEREVDDAANILETTVTALQSRQADLDRIITGLSAAIDASGPRDGDGASTE